MPSVELFEDANTKVNIAELCAGKKTIIFGLPGAFTPVCSSVSGIFLCFFVFF